MYAYDETKPKNGRPCDCGCMCDCADLDAWHEIHDEITELSCLLCEECFDTSRSSWREERARYTAFCSDKCEKVYNEESDDEESDEDDETAVLKSLLKSFRGEKEHEDTDTCECDSCLAKDEALRKLIPGISMLFTAVG